MPRKALSWPPSSWMDRAPWLTAKQFRKRTPSVPLSTARQCRRQTPLGPAQHRRAIPETAIEVSVTLRMTPLQKAHMDAMLEKIRKRSSGAMRQASREELILDALAFCLQSAGSGRPARESVREGGSPQESAEDGEPGQNDGQAGGCTREAGGGTRETRGCTWVHSTSPYQIIIQECPHCGSSSLQADSCRHTLSRASAERIACDTRVLEPGKSNRSSIPLALRRAVLARDGHRCRAKGCGRRQFLELHHLMPRSQGGSNKANNLIVLCSSCHELLHEKDLAGLEIAALAQETAPRPRPAEPAPAR